MKHHEFRRWMRHMAAVPKGYLRRYVLELLSEKPMSGAEIMEEVHKRSGGIWRPSPGSVYPLLAWLQDNGYIKEVQKMFGNGSKRYTLTDKGKRLLDELKEAEGRGFCHGRKAFFWLFAPWLHAASSAVNRFVGEFYMLLNELASLGEEYADVIAEVEEVLSRAMDEVREILRKVKERNGGEDGVESPYKWTPP